MKQHDMKNETKTQGNIQDVFPKNKSIYLAGKPANTTTSVTSLRVGDHNIFLVQNKGKGPPGRQRSPGGYYADHPPDSGNPENIFEQQLKSLTFGQKANIPLNTKYQTKTNFYTQLNFTIMKKQILFLALFLLAVFAGINKSYGQVITGTLATCPTPSLIDCGTTTAAGPLNPIPGVAYDYKVTVAGQGTDFTYDWFVIQDPDFILTSALNAKTGADGIEALVSGQSTHIAAVGSAAGQSPYHTETGSTGYINITWKMFTPDPNDPVFLVIYVKDKTGCTTDNIQVYKIEPKPSFTLDLVNLAVDGTVKGDAFETCVSDIVSAKYNTTSGKVDMNYGDNYLYYYVTAGNFAKSWLPTFKVSGISGTSTMDVAWAYPSDANANTAWNTATEGTPGSGIYTPANAVAAKSPAANGLVASECIVVRVHVAWLNEHNEAGTTINFAVDGIMQDPTATAPANYYTDGTNYGDVAHTGTNCGKIDGYDYDKTTQVITARPTITSDPATGAFIDKNK